MTSGSRLIDEGNLRTHAMGAPRVDLSKALASASTLEGEEVLRKVRLRK